MTYGHKGFHQDGIYRVHKSTILTTTSKYKLMSTYNKHLSIILLFSMGLTKGLCIFDMVNHLLSIKKINI